MKKRRTPDGELRKRAEERLARPDVDAGLSRRLSDDPRQLVHELAVHQIELEMQNEELRAARNETEVLLRRYTELFDFAPIGYAVLDAGGVIRELNLECARMLQAPRAALAAASLVYFVDPRHQGTFSRFLAAVIANTEADHARETCEITLRSPSQERGASTFEVRLIGAALAGAEPRALIAIHDITARKRAEAALSEESRHKDEFLAALSHELRNPLAPIRSSLVVLDRVEPGGAEAQKALAILRRQVDHLVHVVDDLLDMTRIARGKILLEKKPLSLGDLARHAMDDLRPTFQANGVALEDRAGDEDVWVEADATRLLQVIGNLLGNALKFTPRGGRVEVALRREDGKVALSVRDNGVGIEPAVREWLFEPFFQGPQGLDRSRGGLGLGLATVKGLVELHGGTVDVASEGPGTGSEFTVRLPCVPAPPSAAAPPEAKPPSGGRRVLVIEDNHDAAEALQVLLSLDGHEVRLAYDGPTGISLARGFHPEIVFCDIGLPDMDGYDVARAMRADFTLGRPLLVALSGYARPEDRERSLAAGFDRHIAKPPSFEDLQAVVAAAPGLALL